MTAGSSSPPVVNQQGGAFQDFSFGGGAGSHGWLFRYLGPHRPMVYRVSDPACLQNRLFDVAVRTAATRHQM